MALKPKEVLKIESVYKAFYTGGDLEWTNDGEKLICQCGTTIQVVDVKLGRVTEVIGETEKNEENAEDPITTFILSPNNEQVLSAHRSNLFKLWDWKEGKLVKHWRTIHKGPVAKLALSRDGTCLASGGSDSSVRLWDLKHNACTHKLVGIQGVVSVLKFYEFNEKSLVFGAGDDAIIKAWDTNMGNVVFSFSGHFSKVTGIEFYSNGKYLNSCSRDKVIMLWDLETEKQLKTLPLFESAEALISLPEQLTIPNEDKKISGGVYVAVAGERGVVRFWDTLNAKEVFVQSNSIINKALEEGGLSITKLLYNKHTASILVASSDHNIVIHHMDTFQCLKQLSGFADEILDIVYVGPKESHLAIATNSIDIKLYTVSDMNCHLLSGHTDLVVALATTPANINLFASASKDKSIRVWMLRGSGADCICVGARHNNSVGDVALSQTSLEFIVSGAEDTTLKIWNLPKKLESRVPVTLQVKETKLAHDKDINGITVSPNDKIIATASLDKTAKLWSAEDLSLLGTLRGHKRSVWSCNFSPIDQVLLTTSADTTLKLWSLADLSCLKTLEGHDASVLRGYFLTRGTQVVSAGGDGLIKLWCIKTSECISSFDGHDAKVWALAVTNDEEHMVSGGCDSRIVIWRNATEEVKLEKLEAERERILQEQMLANLLQSEDLLSALKLALSLNRPATVLRIVQDVMKSGGSNLQETVAGLEKNEKQQLLDCASHWNSNSKHCYPAQIILSILIDDISTGALKPPTKVIEGLIPFTDRHFKRLTQLLQDLNILEYTKRNLKKVSL